MSLAKRSTTSFTWQAVTNIAQILILLVRTVVLTRLLDNNDFGIYATATSVIGLTAVLVNFGMAGAFVHRAPETEDEELTAVAHFSLKLVIIAIWFVLMMSGVLLFTSGPTQTAFLVITIANIGILLSETPRLILTRRVVHRRLAMLALLNTLATTLISVALAYAGAGLWALLATDLTTACLYILFFYFWKPVWRPKLAWPKPIIRYFLEFGRKNLTANFLLRALIEIDDIWTRIFLGQAAIGYYSRAYTFATYPSRIVATPLSAVAGGTYAELKYDRQRLSKAFFRVNAFIVRTGFFAAGLLALVAPEFIRLALDDRWLPMLEPFRLMLVFTLFDPIKMTIADMFVAVGKPEKVVQARAVQLVVLLVGLFALGPTWRLTGVALAVNVMLVVGIAILLWQAREFVDFSLSKLFAVPLTAVSLGMFLARYALNWQPDQPITDWYTATLKTLVFTLVYGTILILFEYRQTLKIATSITRQLGLNKPLKGHSEV